MTVYDITGSEAGTFSRFAHDYREIAKSPAPTVLRRFSSGAPPTVCDPRQHSKIAPDSSDPKKVYVLDGLPEDTRASRSSSPHTQSPPSTTLIV
jgi:hypothetical protein